MITEFKWLSFCIFFFSGIDAFFTDVGIRFAIIDEANPLMAFIYDKLGIIAFYGIKLLLPIALFFIILSLPTSKTVNVLLHFCLLLYCGVLLLHAYWINLYLI